MVDFNGLLPAHMCAAGDEAVCGGLFTRPTAGPWSMRYPSLRVGVPLATFVERSVGSLPLPLLDMAEREFGPEAFERFWTSELDVEAAFESAFAVDLEDWMLAQIQTLTGSEELPPAISAADAGGSVLFLFLMAGVAVLATRRRGRGRGNDQEVAKRERGSAGLSGPPTPLLSAPISRHLKGGAPWHRGAASVSRRTQVLEPIPPSSARGTSIGRVPHPPLRGGGPGGRSCGARMWAPRDRQSRGFWP